MAEPKKKIAQLPDGITMAQLKENWDTASREYRKAMRRMQLLDAADRGRMWEALKAKCLPCYQILPDTNYVSYVKENILASVYSVGKCAELLPTTPEDKDLVAQLNIALEHCWSLSNVAQFQMEAGERAALTNLGITQVGWDTELSGGNGDYSYQGGPVFKNIDPTKFMRDPFAANLETAGYCMTWDTIHISVLKKNPLYKDTLDGYLSKHQIRPAITQAVELATDGPARVQAQTAKDYVKLITHWVRYGDGIAEIHTIDNEYLLHVTPKIIPEAYPFALLYCNLPAGDLIGTSAPAKVYANTVAYNLFNSILMTAEYKNQRPPKYLRTDSGLNIASFIEHGNDADYTFIVSGDASKAVHYHQYPTPSPSAFTLMNHLPADIQIVSGVDGKYTGRDTGSILTTGGIEAMLDQATLIDAPKIVNYENYTKTLSKLVISNLIAYSAKRKYFVKDPNSTQFKTVTVDFPNVSPEDVFNYQINISTMLPKNKARIAAAANVIMEKQMQYAANGQQVTLMEPEEWLSCQDLPQKELMLERMNIQRNQDYLADVTEILFTFSELVKKGMPAADAIAQTAATMQDKRTPNGVPQVISEEPMAVAPDFGVDITNSISGTPQQML